MKKILIVVLLITTICFGGCIQYPEKPVELKNVTVDSTLHFVQIAPMGSAQITRYSTKGIVVEKTTDTAYVLVETNYKDVRLVISVPSKGLEIKKGYGVVLTAEKWSGGYESGWNYTIKK